MVKYTKKIRKQTIPSYKRTDNFPLIHEPKVKGIRNYIKRIRMALDEEQMQQIRDDTAGTKSSNTEKHIIQYKKNPDFFVNPLSPRLSLSSLRLCQITHLPANYTDSRSKLEAYDKSVLLMIKEMGADRIKMINGIRQFGRDLALG